MRILVIGAGMYVTGREGTGAGTILSSLAESSKGLPIEEVLVVAKSPANGAVVSEAAARINAVIGASLKVRYLSVSGDPRIDVPALCAAGAYDCAIVSIPDHLHFAWTEELLKCGVHSLVVKPLTPTLAEAKALERTREASGVYGAVEFHKRRDATNLWIRKALAERTLGKILYFTVDYSQRISIPMETFREWSARTNIFQYLGVHYVDLIYFLTGFLPVRAMAVGTDGVLKQKGIDSHDSVHATILWRNREDAADWFISNFTTNWIDPVCSSAMSDQKYKVIGTRGRIECDQKNRGVELVHEELGIQQINPYFSDYLPDADGRLRFGGYGHESIERFVRDVLDLNGGTTDLATLESSRPTFRHSLVSTAVVDAVNASLLDGFAWKDIDEIF